MNPAIILVAGALALAPAAAQPAAKQAPKMDPRAERELKAMSDYLAGLPSFQVTATATDEVVLKTGQKIQEVTRSKVSLKRPNMLRSDREGPLANVTFRYDGKEMSIMGSREKYYATAPAPPTLDAMIDVARDQYGLDAPAADLFVSKPYEVLTEDVVSGKYLGLEPVNGVPAHHLAFEGREVDYQIWIQDGPKPVPLRYVIVSKHVPGQPEFTVELTDWKPGASIPDEEFAFKPPAGATQIPFLPMKAAKAAAKERKTR